MNKVDEILWFKSLINISYLKHRLFYISVSGVGSLRDISQSYLVENMHDNLANASRLNPIRISRPAVSVPFNIFPSQLSYLLVFMLLFVSTKMGLKECWEDILKHMRKGFVLFSSSMPNLTEYTTQWVHGSESVLSFGALQPVTLSLARRHVVIPISRTIIP